MKNRILSLIALLMMFHIQSSFAAFPVKNSTAPAATAAATTAHHKAPFAERAANKVYGAAESVQKALHMRNSILPERKSSNTLGLLSLIFGIMGLLGLFTVYFGLPFSIAALVLGIMGRKHNEQFSLAGLILGIIGIALTLLLIVIVIAILAIVL